MEKLMSFCEARFSVAVMEINEEGFRFQDASYFTFVYKENEKIITCRDNPIDLSKNINEGLFKFLKSLSEKDIDRAMKKEELVKAILECGNLHPLLQQYNDPGFMDGSALYAYDGNKEAARKATLDRIQRDIGISLMDTGLGNKS